MATATPLPGHRVHVNSDSTDEHKAPTGPSLSMPFLIGSAAILSSLGSLILWSCLATLASAVIVPGTIVVETGRKSVQQVNGGVLSSILVSDGQEVVAGETLMRLDSASLDLARESLSRLVAMNFASEARLMAEQDNVDTLSFPKQSAFVSAPVWSEIKREQDELFLARRRNLAAKLAMAARDELSEKADTSSFEAQTRAQITKMQLTASELSKATELAKSGFGTQSRVIEIRRSLADMDEELLNLRARRNDAQAAAEHDHLEAGRDKAEAAETSGTELHQALRDQVDLLLKLKTVEQQIVALDIRAPVSGRVVNISVHTVGGVIEPGATVMEVVPKADPLVIEARVRPDDIENVEVGLPVDVRLVGVRGQHLPRLLGTVTRVSADRLEDPVKETPFFRVRVVISPSSLEEIGKSEIRAGMSVTLMIRQGQQSPIAYLVSPILAFFTRSLK